MNDEFRGKILGILGGMGPMAGAVFLERLTVLTPAQVDQEHIPAILWSDPRIPDRSNATICGGEDPLPRLLHGIKRLEQGGAKAIVIPCNTAHLWYDQMAKATSLPILHIVDAAVAQLRLRTLPGSKIGIMGSLATLRSGLYHQRLMSDGFEPILPSDDEIERCCAYAIRLVKANRISEAYHPAAECVGRFTDLGASAVILACTELPLAIPHESRPNFRIELTDSIDGLAIAAIHWFRDRTTGQ